MYDMVKETTNKLNKRTLQDDCGMAYFMTVLSGRWKLSLLAFMLDVKTLRYGELKRKLPAISERMLITQLKELQKDGLIFRTSYPEVPPRVEYGLSDKGMSLKKILLLMSAWGEENRSQAKK
jgi:DNA-binding HxlR family transcriptional regulator